MSRFRYRCAQCRLPLHRYEPVVSEGGRQHCPNCGGTRLRRFRSPMAGLLRSIQDYGRL